MKFLTATDDSGSDDKATATQPDAAQKPDSTEADAGAGDDNLSFDELKAKYAELKTKAGTQAGKHGSELETLNKKLAKAEEDAKASKAWKAAIEKSPEAFIKQAAAEYGLEVKESQPKTLNDVLGANADKNLSPEQVQALIKSEVAAARKEDQAAMRSGLDSFVEERLSTKYPTYDEDADLRRMVRDRVATGDIPQQEVMQAMVLVERMPTLLNEAKVEGVEEYKKQLALKNKEQLEGGGEGGKDPDKEMSPEEFNARLTRK